MTAKLFDGSIITLQLLLREQGMNLGMAWPADPDGSLDFGAGKIALVAPVVMACPRDQMMARECLLASANGADAVHIETALPASATLQERKMAAATSGGHFLRNQESAKNNRSGRCPVLAGL